MTKHKISPLTLKLVTASRYAKFTIEASNHFAFGAVKCNKGEIATGGGFWNSFVQTGTVTFMK